MMARESQVANMSMSGALITEGAGFIGSHLSEALLERACTIPSDIGLDITYILALGRPSFTEWRR
jgi:nucleoside-diphosphate-sugar epimerase